MKGTHLGEFEELVLLIVAVLFDNAYGIAVQEEIAKRSGRKVTISTVHSALHRLDKKGYVTSRYGEATATRGGRRKLLFTVTPAGEGVLHQSRKLRNDLWDSIPELAFKF
ncbi:MAG: helix-turn-helix transcriptional regulator [Saprospiraceae bacterium]|nr:helix-turn-helix transcriptional regulator [Saprospiraceae bacterium]